MFDSYPDVLTIDDLQSALGVGRSMAYRLIRSGDIHHLRIGRKIKVPRSALVAYIESAWYNGRTQNRQTNPVIERSKI